MIIRSMPVSMAAILAFAGLLSAQSYLDDPFGGMKKAMADYQSGDYGQAYEKFNSLTARYPLNGHQSVFRFMAAKSLYKAADYDSAIILFDRFVGDYSRSRYAPSAGLLKGHCYYRQGKMMDAASSYLAAFDLDHRNPDAQLALDNLKPLLQKGLSIWELKQLSGDYPASSLSEEIKFTLARRELQSGRHRSGIKSLESYLRSYPRGEYSEEARDMIKQYSEKAAGNQIIGLLAPVTGSFAEYGRAMVEGARLAMKNHGGDSAGVELLIKDTEGEAVIATKVAAKLTNEEPLAVVGPLRSESSVGVAVVLNSASIPLIAPTASENGIASLGVNVFQMSPAIEYLGQAMAAYAINKLGITEFAIISPDDFGGMAVSKAFAQTVYRLGGEVMSTSYYTVGATDFKQQIKPLRETLLMKTEEFLAAGEIDSSLYIKERVRSIDPVYGDTLESIEMLESEDWPVMLGGLFLPGYPDDLKLLIPQIRYHIIRTRFLGADGWDSAELLREVSRYVGDAVFATDFHVGSDEARWVEFVGAFKAQYGREPDKVAGLTFDAVSLILEGLRSGADTPDKMRNYLSEVEGYQGVSCRVTFKGVGRANNEIRIYSVSGGKVASAR